MNASALYLHIGLIKTATTFLMHEVFPLVSSIHYLRKPKSELVEGMPHHGIFSRFFKRSPVIWSEMGQRLFDEILGEEDAKCGSQDVLIADEEMGVDLTYPCPFYGSRWTQAGNDAFRLRKHLEALSEVALKRGFAQVRVLVTVRRQDTWLASAYAQRSDRLPEASQGHFEHFVHTLLDPAADYHRNGMRLNYNLLYQQLVQAVGRENVLVLPYELIERDLGRFLGKCFAFMEVSQQRVRPIYDALTQDEIKQYNKRSVSPKEWAIQPRTIADAKHRVHLWPRRIFEYFGLPIEVPLRWPEFGRGKKIYLTDALTEEILQTYEASNRLLDGAVNVELSQYGYF